MHGVAEVAHALSLTPIRGAPLPEKTPPKREPHEMPQRRAVSVRGVVQGVGFRPFVYRLASEESLAGFIGNDTDGVTIEIEGPSASLDTFLTRLRSEAPPLARIDSVSVRELEPTGETGFRIVASEVLGRVSTGIPADAATCPDCLRELLSPADRRYPLSLPQLHQLRPPLHHHPPHPLRPPANLYGALQNVPRLPGRIRRPRQPPLSRPAQRLLGLRPAALPRLRRWPANSLIRPRRRNHRPPRRRPNPRHQRHRRIPSRRRRHQRSRRPPPPPAQAPLRKTSSRHGPRPRRRPCALRNYPAKKKLSSPLQRAPSSWSANANPAPSLPPSPRAFPGSASFSPTRPCTICSSQTRASRPSS